MRHPVALGAARRELARRLRTRGETFLALVRDTVYGRPETPYARLLRHAGCEASDLERLVRRDGVEGALGTLRAAGVYLTSDELRGRRPVRRGGLTLAVEPSQLWNPRVAWDLPIRSGGSRSAGLPFGWNLDFVRDRAVNLSLWAAALGPAPRRHAIWEPLGSGAIVHLLDLLAEGRGASRWFSPVDPAATDVSARYRWSARLARAGSWLGGRVLPAPAPAPLLAPGPVVEWLASVLAAGERPAVHARPSAVLRMCEAAAARGVDLRGTEVAIGGEPITRSRAAALRSAGLRVLPRYAASETGLIGNACLEPRGADDVHVFHDLVAVIPDDCAANGRHSGRGILVSSLRPAAPLVLLNASMGDVAVLDDTPCGCPVAAEGWPARLRGIERLDDSALDVAAPPFADIARALDETLPGRFGGGPGDYQLVEDALATGATHWRLLVHPAVGPIDPRAVAAAFVAVLDGWPGHAPFAVERHVPLVTAVGKVLHVHRTPSEVERAT